MVSFVDERLGDVSDQLLLSGQRRATVRGQADAVGHAEDVCVDGHARLVEDDGGDHVGRLTPHAGQLHQLLDAIGDVPSEVVPEHTSGTD